MSDGDAIFARICKNPKDFTRYFVHADWLEDQGEPIQAECWRLLGEFGKYPAYVPPDSDEVVESSGRRYWWHPISIRDTLRHAAIPSNMWGNIATEHVSELFTAAAYFSRREAFTAFITMYCKMKPSSRLRLRKGLERMAKK